MALITENPGGLPPEENTLRDIPDDLLAPRPQMLRLSGRDLFAIDTPMETGEFVKAEFIMRAGDLIIKKDGDHVRVMEYVGAKLTVEPYKVEDTPPPPEDDENTPPMFGRDGQIPDDEPEDEIAPDDDGLNEFDPAFSHNGQ